MNVVVDGLMTNYLKTGSGKDVLILLHGWGDSAQTFAQLANQMEGCTIYAPDLPGFGQTQKPPSAWGLEDYADFVENWLEKIGMDGTYSLAGHSFGGAVAIKGVAEGILRPRKLILLASAGVRNKSPLRNKILRVGAKFARLPLFLLPPNRAQNIKQKLYKRIGSDVLVVPGMRQTFVKTVSEDVRPFAGRIKVPTLSILANRDNETPESDGRELQAVIPGSHLKIVESGHYLHQEQARQVAGMIRQFIKGKN